ncbi:hypothetical protein AGMMS50229_04870 [Campylobacterota bacterium]|nr:hypothetical protein AGMMS50229_04870 [Campylobacterota bacterium]
MKILFLIGNGFDLNVGLNTRYKDALGFYLQEQKTDERIEKFQKDIKQDRNNDFKNWADFETKLGVYTEQYNQDTVDDFCFCVKDFKSSLIKHLKNEENKINYDLHKQEIITTCGNAITRFYKGLNSVSYDSFKSEMEKPQHINYDFITFNYTTVFDKCLDMVKKVSNHNAIYCNIRQILHIHGKTSEHPLLGVDNAGQITNKEFANNPKIKNLMIKPITNNKLRNSNNQAAKQLIQSSDIICLFGLSLGETDKTWWQQIGVRLQQSKAQLVIFARANNKDTIHADEVIENRENIENKFCAAANIDDKIKTGLVSRIHVGLDTDLFKMNLVNDKASKMKRND